MKHDQPAPARHRWLNSQPRGPPHTPCSLLLINDADKQRNTTHTVPSTETQAFLQLFLIKIEIPLFKSAPGRRTVLKILVHVRVMGSVSDTRHKMKWKRRATVILFICTHKGAALSDQPLLFCSNPLRSGTNKGEADQRGRSEWRGVGGVEINGGLIAARVA